MKASRALLFDFNGVIIDDEEQHREALTEVLDGYGIALSRERYYDEFLGFDDRGCFRHAFKVAGLDLKPGEVARAIAQKTAAYSRALETGMKLVPGAVDFIEQTWRSGIQMAVVSGALRREIEMVLKQCQILDLFDAIVAAEDVTACKPSPEGYLYGLDLLGAESDGSIAIEDSRPGIEAALQAGVRVTALTTSYPAGELARAALVWDDFSGHSPDELPWN